MYTSVTLLTVALPIFVMFLPPNCTAGIQPMDQNVIRILNMNYRKSFVSIFFSSSTNLMHTLKNFSLSNEAYLASNAWDIVDGGVLKKCFNKILYDEGWSSDEDLSLAVLGPSTSTEIVDLLVDISPDVYHSNEINEWLNDDIEITDDEVEEDNDN